MRKKKNYLKTGILLFGILLLLWNCQHDEILMNANNYETVSIEEAKDFF
jgi:hypothetical protein